MFAAEKSALECVIVPHQQLRGNRGACSFVIALDPRQLFIISLCRKNKTALDRTAE
jgi:hypothetical protein